MIEINENLKRHVAIALATAFLSTSAVAGDTDALGHFGGGLLVRLQQRQSH